MKDCCIQIYKPISIIIIIIIFIIISRMLLRPPVPQQWKR